MKQSIAKALTCLKYANFIVILGSGITWTGLSYDLATKYADPRFMAFMQVLSVISSFLGPFIALWLLTRSRMRSIIVGSEIISTICCVGIFFLLLNHQGIEFHITTLIGASTFLILLSGSISGLFIEPLYANLVEKRDGSDKEVRREFATFAYFGILSKLCGMSVGPFLFSLLNEYSLLVNSLTFLISSFLLWTAMKNVPSDVKLNAIRPEEVTIFRKSTWKEIIKLPLLETAIANSLIFVVVLSMSTQAMVLQATPVQLSSFWFGATGCAFFSHFSLSRYPKIAEFLFSLEKKIGFIQIIPIIFGLMYSNIVLLIVSQWIFSLLNPLTTNQSRADFYREFGRDSEKALDAYAMRNILTNSIVLIFSLFVSLVGSKMHNTLLTIALMALIVLRWVIALRIQLKNSAMEIIK